MNNDTLIACDSSSDLLKYAMSDHEVKTNLDPEVSSMSDTDKFIIIIKKLI